MTVQTGTHPGIRTGSTTRARGVKGFVIGLAALVAAATGIGIAVSGSEAPTTVIAPVSEINPAAEQREALERLQRGPSAGSAAESEVVRYPSGKPQMK